MDSIQSHEKVLRKLAANKKPKIRTVFGEKILVLPHVFDPRFFDSRLMAKTIAKAKTNLGKTLDLGTGTGIQAIFASPKASMVVACDISSYALTNALFNFEMHDLAKKISLVKSDLFSNVIGRFDTIIFNPPFFGQRPHTLLEKAITSTNHSVLIRFFENVSKHLTKTGQIFLVYSEAGDAKLLNRLIHEKRFKSEILIEVLADHTKYFVYRIVK